MEPARPYEFAAGPDVAGPEPVPEARDLPPKLVCGLRTLVGLAAPTVSFTVRPQPESVTEARHFALSRLDGWGVPRLRGDVGLVVSELVTNALRHSTAPTFRSRPSRAPAHSAGHRPGRFANGAAGTGPGADHRTGRNAGPGHGPALETGLLGAAPAGIRLRLLYEAPWLLCGITDCSPSAPRRREPDYIAETGRGLHLVESFSALWGWCGLPQGKVVWALFRSH